MSDVEETEVAVVVGEPAVRRIILAEADDPADGAVEEAGPAPEEVEVEMDYCSGYTRLTGSRGEVRVDTATEAGRGTQSGKRRGWASWRL